MSKFSKKLAVAAWVLGVISISPAMGGAVPASGSLDKTFDTDGKVITSFTESDEVYASATQTIQSQEMIVVGGSLYLTRYTSNGSLDNTFGTGGIVSTSFPIRALAVQADGKIVAAGYTAGTYTDLAVARFNSNGTLDTSFGNGGVVTVAISTGGDGARAVAIQADGKIVAAGYTNINGGFNDFALVRLNANGTLDGGNGGFGTNGIVITSVTPYHDQVQSIAINSVDGSIVVAGGSGGYYGAPVDFALARYTSSGVLVGGFGNGGIVITDFGGYEGVADVALQMINSELKIVAGGSSNLIGSDDFALARYSYLNGGLDSSFGTGGKVITDFFGSTDLANGLAIQSDNKIVLAGGAHNAKTAKTLTAVARYTPSGALDLTFDRDGKVTTDFGYAGNTAMGVLLQAGNKIVAVGYAYIYRVKNIFALARYNP